MSPPGQMDNPSRGEEKEMSGKLQMPGIHWRTSSISCGPSPVAGAALPGSPQSLFGDLHPPEALKEHSSGVRDSQM